MPQNSFLTTKIETKPFSGYSSYNIQYIPTAAIQLHTNCYSHKNYKGSIIINNAIITCISNDVGYKYIFSKQLENKATQNDMLLLLSGSGNSENLIESFLINKNYPSNLNIVVFSF